MFGHTLHTNMGQGNTKVVRNVKDLDICFGSGEPSLWVCAGKCSELHFLRHMESIVKLKWSSKFLWVVACNMGRRHGCGGMSFNVGMESWCERLSWAVGMGTGCRRIR